MSARRLLADIGEGFRGSPGRIALSLTALSVGMIALTLLLAVMAGLRERAQRMTAELGANVIAILPGGDASSTLRPELASLLAANLTNATVSGTSRASFASPNGRATWEVVSADSSFGRVKDWGLRAGRLLDDHDLERAQRNAVITESLAKRNNLAVGSALRMQETVVTVVGIIAGSGGSSGGEAWTLAPDTIIIPRTVSLRDHDATWRQRELNAIFLRLDATRALGEQLREAERIVATAGRDPKSLSWVTPESLIAGIRRMQQAVGIAAGGIAGLCLVLGGMTLMSLMLANVRERIGEIGLRRALGASPADIAGLFIFEACLTTLLAAGLGGGCAVAAARGLAARFDLPMTITPAVVAIPILASVVLGCIFAALPARRAARLQPAEALRNE